MCVLCGRQLRLRWPPSDLAVGERVDDHAESGQALVDLLGLFERLTCGASLANLPRDVSALVLPNALCDPDLFTAGQIDEVEIPRFLCALFGIALMNTDDKDGMRAGGLGVHLGRRHCARSGACTHDFVDFLFRAHVDFCQVFHVNAPSLVFVD